MSRKPLDEIVREAARLALKRVANQLDVEFTNEISDTKWDWPRQPSPRDIVDTGRLRASQQRTDSPDGVQWSWGVDYAAQVHEGATFKNGLQTPARPWTVEPISKAQQLYDEQFRRALREVKTGD